MRELVKLATMEATTEDHVYTELFFRKINEMLVSSSFGNFNPIVIQCDEHGSAKIALKDIYGEDFVECRTSGCEYHLQKSVDKHKKYFNKEDAIQFNMLVNALKNCVTEEGYNREKSKIDNLILKQAETCREPLSNMIKFWNNCKYRWASAYKNNLHNSTRSSLAEAAQSSMKAGGEKNLSLVDSVYSDIADSARLEAKWLNRVDGERCVGSGPSRIELERRNERRQVGRANQFISELAQNEENQEYEESDDDQPLLSSQPPKAKKRRLKSLESKYFQAILKKSKSLDGKLSLIEMKKSNSSLRFIVKQAHTIRNIEISMEEIICDCSQSQLATRKTCHHIVWLFLKLFKVSENDQLIAQTDIGASSFQRLVNAMPESIPSHLSKPTENDRTFSDKLKDHRKFNDIQTWYLARKSNTKPSRCSGCLQPRKILPGELHLYVSGLLHLEQKDNVVETKLRFCIKSRCVRDIKSSLNNIRSMDMNTVILRDSSLNGVKLSERKVIEDNSFNVEGLENIPILSEQ